MSGRFSKLTSNCRYITWGSKIFSEDHLFTQEEHAYFAQQQQAILDICIAIRSLIYDTISPLMQSRYDYVTLKQSITIYKRSITYTTKRIKKLQDKIQKNISSKNHMSIKLEELQQKLLNTPSPF